MLLEASPQLNSLPQLWLNHLLAHMQRGGQSRDDIVRRSAGLPAAFVAVFTAEPTGHPKTLLQQGTPLMDTADLPHQRSHLQFFPHPLEPFFCAPFPCHPLSPGGKTPFCITLRNPGQAPFCNATL